jgi:hypothetical protein
MLKKSSSKALEIAPVIVEVEAALEVEEVEEAEEVSEVVIVVVTVVAEVEEVEWVEEVEEVEVKIEANLQTLTLTLSKTVTLR